jgi:hypothetical protein
MTRTKHTAFTSSIDIESWITLRWGVLRLAGLFTPQRSAIHGSLRPAATSLWRRSPHAAHPYVRPTTASK